MIREQGVKVTLYRPNTPGAAWLLQSELHHIAFIRPPSDVTGRIDGHRGVADAVLDDEGEWVFQLR
jgi:hypothetical protein